MSGIDLRFDPFCVWGNEIFMNKRQVRKLRKIHYCRMLLTRHYDRRPIETVCDAFITNGDVKKPSKRCKTFGMDVASNKVQSLVACAIQGIRFSPMNRLR